jgi:hypothetical protein
MLAEAAATMLDEQFVEDITWKFLRKWKLQ